MQDANKFSEFSEADLGNVIPPWVTFALKKKKKNLKQE